jgi:hypothetical protein
VPARHRQNQVYERVRNDYRTCAAVRLNELLDREIAQRVVGAHASGSFIEAYGKISRAIASSQPM